MSVDLGHRKPWKRILKTMLWIAGIWLAVLMLLQIVLSPSMLTKAVNKYAAAYVDGSLSFGKVRLSVFRHFPNIGISMHDGALTYPAERYDSLETAGAQGILLREGCGEVSDTLASFRQFSAGINVGALIAGKISIPHIILVQPRIFAHSYDAGEANWNIFRLESEDSTETALPPVSIGRIRLTGHPRIVYTDSRDTIFAMLDVKKMSFDGRLDTRKTSRNRISFSMDSLLVAGRIAEDTVGFRLAEMRIQEHNRDLQLYSKANAMLATRSFGRMDIPIAIKGNASFPKDSVPAVRLSGFEVEIASVPIRIDADLRRADGCTEINGRFSINECRLEKAKEEFLQSIIPETKKIRTDAVISMEGNCKGIIGKGSMPAMNISLTIPDSHISHKDIPQELKLGLNAAAFTDDSGRIHISLDEFKVGTNGLELMAKGGSEDILGEDPLVEIDGNISADLNSLASLIPDKNGLEAAGSIEADLNGRIRLSQMSIYNFAQADLEGYILSDSLVVKSPEDTIDASIKGLDIQISPESIVSRSDSGREFRLLSIKGKISQADMTYGKALSFSGKEIELSAKNSADAFSDKDTTKVHPLGGRLCAASLSLKDASGLSVSLDNTANSFLMMPKKDHPEIPVVSLTSTNKRIFVRDLSNRLILTDASIKGKAVMNTMEDRQERRARRDSLMRSQASTRGRRIIPEWMKEEDFKAQDINIKLDESIAGYFRDWDLDGRLNVRTGILITPYFPLRNILKGMDVSFNNNEFTIDSLSFTAGDSQIGAKGSLSGLRRALLGRGTYKLDLDITSERMDADALLAAFNAGAAFAPAADNEDMAQASDSEFLKMVITDSLSMDEPQKLIVIPANLNADIRLDAKDIKFSGLEISSLGADMIMKERCLQLLNTSVTTNVGNGSLEGFYATRTKKDIRTGFNLGLRDITTEKVISMMPAIDTIMPLLKSFKGLVNCEFAATASLDTNMNVIMPSINGVLRVGGENLSMSGEKVFSDLAKKLKFKDREEGRIDKMTVEGIIQDNTIEVFPFIIDIDRYTLALSGKHNLDQSFRYHASIIRSPMVFKVGVDIYGPDFENMKFKIGKPKYKNTKVPVFTEVIDRTRINLAESIRGIFEKGVEAAVKENERQDAIASFKKETGYVSAVDQQLEELSDDEKKQLEEPEEEKSQEINKEKQDTLNEQSGIH